MPGPTGPDEPTAAQVRVIDREAWEAMSAEEQDALIASGWHPGPVHYDHEWASGIINERNALRVALEEAIGWARRPSPIPMVPFNEFLDRMGKLGVGPRAVHRG